MADTNGRSSRPRRAPARSSRPAAARGASSGSSADSSRATAETSSRRAAASSASGTRRGGASSGKRRFFDYPRSGYTGLHRWLPSWRVVVGTFLGGCFLVAGGMVAAYATIQIPEAGDEISAQTTTVYFAGDEPDKPGPVMGTLPGVNRQIVEYEDLPPYIGQAVAAGEDKTFFTNSGVDIKGMARALYANVTKGTRQGGSSLTQEYVERYYVGKTTTSYVGKLKETLLALKIGRTQSKDEILERYLNTIYFGRGAYGIQAASKAYYGIDAKDMTVSQAALLAGIIPGPTYWDPAVNPDRAEYRWGVILDSMESMGWITPAERAKQEFPETIAVKNSETFKGTNGYLLRMVIDELKKPPYSLSEDTIQTGGYSIITTIQKPAQKAAVAAANDLYDGTLGNGKKPKAGARVAIVSVDPTDGAIVALYGGKDFLSDQRNAATFDPIQAGSTFKPFTLVTALEEGIGLGTRFNGRSPQTLETAKNGDWTVRNFGSGSGEQFGNIDLVTATEHSVNTVYGQLNIEVGPEKVVETATRAGVTTSLGDNASNVLGTGDVKPIDMASAYATFAAEGKRSTPFIVRTVLNPKGSVAYQAKPDPQQVFAKDVMADATYAMTKVVESGTAARWIGSMDRPIAGKTGTTTDNKGDWFVGFTPHISTAVAMFQYGTDNKSKISVEPIEPGLSEVTGGDTPAHIWNLYMSKVFEIDQFSAKTEFPERANIGVKASVPTSSPTASSTPEPTTTKAAKVTVPTGLVGRLEADATAALFGVGLTPNVTSASSDTVGVGRVISVTPGEGSAVAAGAQVTLVVSTGPKTPVTQQPTAPPTTPPATTPADDGSGDGDAEPGKGDEDQGGDASGGGAGSGGTTKG